MRIRIVSNLVKVDPGQVAEVTIPDAETEDGLLFQTVERHNVRTVEVLTVVTVEDE